MLCRSAAKLQNARPCSQVLSIQFKGVHWLSLTCNAKLVAQTNTCRNHGSKAHRGSCLDGCCLRQVFSPSPHMGCQAVRNSSRVLLIEMSLVFPADADSVGLPLITWQHQMQGCSFITPSQQWALVTNSAVKTHRFSPNFSCRTLPVL